MKVIRGILGLLWKLYILVVFVLTALLFYPLITPLLNNDRNKRKAYKLFVAWSWVVRVLCFYFVRKLEDHPLPDGNCVIIANHASYLDIFLMPSLFPKKHFIFLGKSEILSYPLLKTYFKRFNIPVYRDSKIKAARAMFQAVDAGKKGWSLMLFPEGGIPDDPHPFLDSFKPGAFQIAKQLHVPIIPVTFVNNFSLFSDPEYILGPASPGISKVYIHQAIPVSTVDDMDIETLSGHSREIILKALRQHYPQLK